MVKTEVGNRFLVITKTRGKFYNAYDNNAVILSYLCNYKLLDNKKSGFPDSAINKVINVLDDNKISYQIIYTDKDPLVKDFKKLNTYSEILEKATKSMDMKSRIEIIIEKIKNADAKKMDEILEGLERCLG